MTKSGYGKQNGGRKRVLRRSGVPPEIHCMMIPAQDATLLLPTSVMAEVMDYVEPQPIEDSPPWLFGQVEWEGRQVPVFDFSALINGADPQSPTSRARIMVLKSLSDSNRMPYIGLLMTGLPRPVTLKDSALEQTGDEKKSLGVFSHVRLEGEDAIIPDMDRLSHLVRHATFGALPITQLDQ
jgi:chemosensory pili system protein ChpC